MLGFLEVGSDLQSPLVAGQLLSRGPGAPKTYPEILRESLQIAQLSYPSFPDSLASGLELAST